MNCGKNSGHIGGLGPHDDVMDRHSLFQNKLAYEG